MRKLGTLEPVVYFRNHRDPAHPEGFLMLAPYSEFPTPRGYSRETAETLSEVDRLQKILLEQEQRQWEAEAIYDEVVMGQRQRAVVDRLRTRMVSGATSPYERDFIEAYLALREDKREKYRQRWMERTAYLHAREYDTPKGRAVDDEGFRVDRIG